MRAAPEPLAVRAAPLASHAEPPAVRAGLFGLGIFALGLAFLVWGDFVPGQPVPNDFPHRTALAYLVAAFLLIAGAALQFSQLRSLQRRRPHRLLHSSSSSSS